MDLIYFIGFFVAFLLRKTVGMTKALGEKEKVANEQEAMLAISVDKNTPTTTGRYGWRTEVAHSNSHPHYSEPAEIQHSIH